LKFLFKLLSKVAPSVIDEYITRRWVKPLDFGELTLAFIDTTGKAWYEFPDGLGNPMKRMAANLQAYEYLTARMSPEMFDAAVIDINAALAHGKVVEAGAILTRLKTLKDEVIPVDVLINLIATDLVREDEKPQEHNQAIHQEKCDYLKTAIDNGDSFFFHLTVVKDLSKRFKISNEGWTLILKGFQEAVKEAKKERDILLSMNLEKESQATPTPSTSS
jgi:hypothetical protein